MRLLLVLTGSLVPVLAGCGGPRVPALVPAGGKVVLKQKDGAVVPLGGAKLVLVPVAGGDRYPTARAAADGSFRLATDGADGAPEGEYVVTVEWRDRQQPKFDVDGRGEVDRGPNRLRAVYADRATSPLRATVAAGRDLTVEVPGP